GVQTCALPISPPLLFFPLLLFVWLPFPVTALPLLGLFDAQASADAVVLNPALLQQLRIVQVAAIENDRILEAILDQVEVGRTEFHPLRADHQNISPLQSLLFSATKGQALFAVINPLGFFHGLWVESLNPGACCPHSLTQGAAGDRKSV